MWDTPAEKWALFQDTESYQMPILGPVMVSPLSSLMQPHLTWLDWPTQGKKSSSLSQHTLIRVHGDLGNKYPTQKLWGVLS